MGTRYVGSEEEKRALESYIKLSRALASVDARINAHLGGHGLSTSQFGVLEALYHLGPLHQHQLARKILKSSGNLTLVLDNLEKRGLITRTRDPQDRRCVRVVLSEAGRALIEMIMPAHVAGVVAAFAPLSAEEQRQLAELCKKLGLAQLERRAERGDV